MNTNSRLIALSLAAAVAGCATADFTPYVGAQQNWPTAPGTFVATQYAVPVYHGLPLRPYIVLGYLDATTAPVRRREVVEFATHRVPRSRPATTAATTLTTVSMAGATLLPQPRPCRFPCSLAKHQC